MYVGNRVEIRRWRSPHFSELPYEIFRRVFIRASIRGHPGGINGRYTDMRESNAAERRSPGAVIDLSVKSVDPHSPADTIDNQTYPKIIWKRKWAQLSASHFIGIATSAISGPELRKLHLLQTFPVRIATTGATILLRFQHHRYMRLAHAIRKVDLLKKLWSKLKLNATFTTRGNFSLKI